MKLNENPGCLFNGLIQLLVQFVGDSQVSRMLRLPFWASSIRWMLSTPSILLNVSFTSWKSALISSKLMKYF